jgi:hypothetical protein
MGAVVSYYEHKIRAGRGRARAVDPLVVEIIEALVALGGGAHRQSVADEIAVRRTGRACRAEAALQTEVYAAFDGYLTWAATRKVPPLLHLPLGAGSYRWALTDAGMNLLRPSASALSMAR